jgi:hypothetical protein
MWFGNRKALEKCEIGGEDKEVEGKEERLERREPHQGS